MIRRALPWALCTLVLWLPAAEALARVGGGQSFGGGGGGHSGGGGGGDGDLIFLILELVIRYPKVGVPLLIMFLVFMGAKTLWEQRSGRHVVATHTSPVHRNVGRRAIPGLDQLRVHDRGFSMPVLKDFLVLIHRRALEAANTGEWATLLPFVDAGARKRLTNQLQQTGPISEVVVGAAQVLRVTRRGRYERLAVRFDGARLESGEKRFRVDEVWTFRRLADASSLPPDDILRLGCPSCGASVETTRMGACAHCGTPITAGQLQWQLVDVKVTSKRAFEPPAVGFFKGGDEPSVQLPSVDQPQLTARLRELQARHPDFDMIAFSKRIQGIYMGLQNAWSDNKWQEARPWVTDPMYQSLRFWIEQYASNGLRNQLTDVKLVKTRLVKVEVDAWYESITVRIWGSMKDSVVNAKGAVVGGNDKVARNFSEYWTFVRAAGTGGEVHDPRACPSCGAPLDKVGQAGECGYCGSVITTGRFDWTLSSIEQCESYNGS